MFVGSHHILSLTGRIVKDLEMWMNENGIPVLKFAIPTNDVYRDAEGEKYSETTWFNITLTGDTAHAAFKTLKRGDHIQVIGRLKPEIKVREMKNGKVVGEYEVIADEVIFLQGGYKDDRW